MRYLYILILIFSHQIKGELFNNVNPKKAMESIQTKTEGIQAKTDSTLKKMEDFNIAYNPCSTIMGGRFNRGECEKKLVTRLGDKYFVYQQLVKLFGESKIQRNIYYNYLLPYSSFFGGTCDHASTVSNLNDDDSRLSTCQDSTPNQNNTCQAFGVGMVDVRHNYFNISRCFSNGEMDRKLITSSNTARIGLNSLICFYSVFGVETSSGVGEGQKYLMNNVCGSDSCEWSSGNIKTLYKLFYPYAVDFSSDDNSQLKSAVEGSENKLDDNELFQVLSYSLCADISWQSF